MDEPAKQHGLTNLRFHTKLLLGMCGLVLLTGVLIVAVADHSGRSSTSALVDSLFREVSRHAVTQTRDFVVRAAPVAQSLEELANQGLAMDDFDRLALQLLAFLKGNPGLTFVLYGDESGEFAGALRLRDGSLHIQRSSVASGRSRFTEFDVLGDGSQTLFQQDDARGYDPRTRPFYILAKERGKLSWTPPYMFFSTGLPGISCVIPARTASGEFRGVFSVEFDLNALSEFVSALSISEHSRVFLFTPDQTLLAHPNQRGLVGKGVKGSGALLTLADTGDPLVDGFRRHLQPRHLDAAAVDDFHFFEFEQDGVGYLASTTVFTIGDGQSWVVGAVAPQADFLAGVWRTRWLALAAAGAALAIAAVLAAALSRRISRPVDALIGFMQRVGGGDLEARADFRSGPEFRQLSIELNQMIADLRERLHLRNSLHLAMEVQKSLLPANDPVRPRLDVAGRSKYCDDTGGDYYDFIDVGPVSDSAMLIAVGDVMGHGIPAALVMATARASLRTSAMRDHGLAELMTRTNHVLAQGNRHNRFMTLSLLLIDADTRIVRWASGGHDPAIVYDPATDSMRELDGGDMPLGLVPGVEYEEFTTDALPPESVIIIGTDGVWEMFNEQDAHYGKERMQWVVRENHARPAGEIAAALEADLASYRGTRNPADDVTFVIIKFIARPAEKPGAAIPLGAS